MLGCVWGWGDLFFSLNVYLFLLLIFTRALCSKITANRKNTTSLNITTQQLYFQLE